jgi:hypothetical protein
VLPPRVKRASLTGALLATAVVSFLVATSSSPPAKELPDAYFARKLQVCLPADPTPTQQDIVGADSVVCLREYLLDAATLDNLKQARRALDRTLRTMPILHDACHVAEHQVGQVLPISSGDVARLLLANPENVCSWGLGHGLLEAFGSLQASSAQWVEMAELCDSFPTRPEPFPQVHALCADGLGHAAWNQYGALEPAASRCDLLGSSSRDACAAGIMMQLFRPADRDPSASASRNPPSGFCDTWPSEESARGCALGMGYVLALNLVTDRLAAELFGSGSAPDQLRAASLVASELELARNICYEGVFPEDCSAAVLQNVPWGALGDTEARLRLCSELSAPWRARCGTFTG